MKLEPKQLLDAAFTRLAVNMTVEQLEDIIKSLVASHHQHALAIFKAELERRKNAN